MVPSVIQGWALALLDAWARHSAPLEASHARGGPGRGLVFARLDPKSAVKVFGPSQSPRGQPRPWRPLHEIIPSVVRRLHLPDPGAFPYHNLGLCPCMGPLALEPRPLARPWVSKNGSTHAPAGRVHQEAAGAVVVRALVDDVLAVRVLAQVAPAAKHLLV